MLKDIANRFWLQKRSCRHLIKVGQEVDLSMIHLNRAVCYYTSVKYCHVKPYIKDILSLIFCTYNSKQEVRPQ